MSDPYKLRAMGLLIAAGFVGGLYLQYKTPGQFMPAARHAKKHKKHLAAAGAQASDDDEAPEDNQAGGASGGGADAGASASTDAGPAAGAGAGAGAGASGDAGAEGGSSANASATTFASPTTQADFDGSAAISLVVGNTIQLAPKSRIGSYYFSRRGVAGEISGDRAVARIWKLDGDRLCEPLDAKRQQCLSLKVRLETALRQGAPEGLLARIEKLPDGARIGSVDGPDFSSADLIHGNTRRFPDFVPLLESPPKDTGALIDHPGAASAAPGLVGAILAQTRQDADRAVTLFAPWGRLFEVSRTEESRNEVRLWWGAWRRDGQNLCRELPTDPDRDGPNAKNRQECSRYRIVDQSVMFLDAPNGRRDYWRMFWAGAANQPAMTQISDDRVLAAKPESGALTLVPDSASHSDLTDLR